MKKLPLILPLLLASTLCAQVVQFRGKIENESASCYYCPNTGYVLACSDYRLAAGPGIAFAPFNGVHVRGTATIGGTTSNPQLNVITLEPTAETFSIGGGGELGGDFGLTAWANPGDVAFFAAALTKGLSVIPTTDVLFLNPNAYVLLGAELVDGEGEANLEVLIPNIPSLFGINVFSQALIAPTSGTPFLTNLDCKTIG